MAKAYLKVYFKLQKAAHKLHKWTKEDQQIDLDGDSQKETVHVEKKDGYHLVRVNYGDETLGVDAFAFATKAHGIPIKVSYDETKRILTVGVATFNVYGETNEADDILAIGKAMSLAVDQAMLLVISQGIPGKLPPLEIVYGGKSDYKKYIKDLKQKKTLSPETEIALTKSYSSLLYGISASNAFSVSFYRKKGITNFYNFMFLNEHVTWGQSIVGKMGQLGTNDLKSAVFHEISHVAERFLIALAYPAKENFPIASVFFWNYSPGYRAFIDQVVGKSAYPNAYVQKKFKGSKVEGAEEYSAEQNRFRLLGRPIYSRSNVEMDERYDRFLEILYASHGDPEVVASLMQNAGALLLAEE